MFINKKEPWFDDKPGLSYFKQLYACKKIIADQQQNKKPPRSLNSQAAFYLL